MTLFGLVRHGQTDYNLHNLFQGSSDIPLNDTGIQQAHHALDELPAVHWDVVITSPLQRAEQTGRIIAEDHGITFGGTVPALREIDWGAAEGREVAEMEELYPGRSFPGREDHQHVADRGYAALEQLAATYPRENVLVVAHGTIIRFLLSGILGTALDGIPNATLSLVRLEQGAWSVEMIANRPLAGSPSTGEPGHGPRFRIDPRHLAPGADQGTREPHPAPISTPTPTEETR